MAVERQARLAFENARLSEAAVKARLDEAVESVYEAMDGGSEPS